MYKQARSSISFCSKLLQSISNNERRTWLTFLDLDKIIRTENRTPSLLNNIDKLRIFHANQTAMCLDLYQNLPSSDFLLTVPRRCFFCGSFLLFMGHVYLSYVSCLCVAALRSPDLLALLCVVFSGVFVTFSYGVPGQV